MLKLKTIAILSLISVNAFAYTGHGFKIISEKVTQTPGFNGRTVSLDKHKGLDRLRAEVKAFQAVGSRTDFITIQSWHVFSVFNNTNTTQRYTYNFVLFSGDARYNFEKTVELYSHGNYFDDSMNYGAVQKENVGYYDITAQTKVTGAENGFSESHALLHVMVK